MLSKIYSISLFLVFFNPSCILSIKKSNKYNEIFSANGNIVSEQKVSLPKGGQGIERIYYVDGKHYLLTGVGTNGFIVTSYPVEIKIRRN